MGNAVQLAPCHKDVSPQGPELQRRIPAQLQHPSSGRLVQMPGQRYRIQEAGNTISTRDRRVKPQEGHPWSEKLRATKAEARYMTHKKDMPREESRESQGVRARGDNDTAAQSCYLEDFPCAAGSPYLLLTSAEDA